MTSEGFFKCDPIKNVFFYALPHFDVRAAFTPPAEDESSFVVQDFCIRKD